MDVSLIIATRDRCEKLARCLQSVRQISFERPWELIVVDNGSRDGTAAIVREFTNIAPIPARYVFEPKPGLGNAHNAGVRIARAQILAFTDDDCYPAPDFLSSLWSAFRDPSVGYIGGRILLYDPADFKGTVTHPKPVTFPPNSFIAAGSFFGGANMAFRQEVLTEIGGFDPLFGPGALFNCEDYDAAGRASAIGWKGQYRPEVVVWHHHGRKEADRPPLMKSFGIGIGAYHMKVLLKGRHFRWFAIGIHQISRRYKWSPRCAAWEPVGMMMYAYVFLRETVCDWMFGLHRVAKGGNERSHSRRNDFNRLDA
jgi:glycosyltransferase involved in cell wall biosynthesis